MLRRIQCLAPLLLLPALAHAQTAGNSYTQSNLLSDGSVTARQTDPSLINPWGVAIGQQTPFWINAAGSGISEVYDSGGNKQFVVNIPSGQGGINHGSPTGIAFNTSTRDFVLRQGGSALFIFDSLDGVISAWNASLTNAQTVIDHSGDGAVYTGLALENNGTSNYILAANFAKNTIEVYENEFASITLSGRFVDPAIPQGYAPFNVHVLNNKVYVMYAMQTPGAAFPTAGAGNGYVSVFDTNGNFLNRAISRGNLNAPWGLAQAPATFGAFGGDLLVGNFGDGKINAYDPNTFALVGQLQDATGNPVVNNGLWEILFGQNGTGDPNTLYFSAGINGERGGLFGSIVAASPAGAGDFQLALSVPSLTLSQGSSASLTLNVKPSGGFNSPVTFNVSGLPPGLTFNFAPATVTPGSDAGVSSTLTLSPTPYTGPPPTSPYTAGLRGGGPRIGRMIAGCGILPLGLASLIGIRRRRKSNWSPIVLGGSSLSLLLVLGALAGCGSSTNGAGGSPIPIPTGNSTVTVTATSGSVVHTTTFMLTVQ